MDMYTLLDVRPKSKKKILFIFLILIGGIYYCSIIGEIYFLDNGGKIGNVNGLGRKSVSDKQEKSLGDFIAHEERKTGNVLDTGGRGELHRRLLAEDELLVEHTRTRSRPRPSRIFPSIPERKRCKKSSRLYYGTKMTEAREWKKISNEFEAFSAFLVRRNGQSTVEIISRGNVSVAHCLLWYTDVPWAVRSFVKVSFKYSSLDTTVLSCALPKEDERTIPSAVSLSEIPCQRTNNIFKVIKTADYPGVSVGICLKLFDARPRLDSVIELLERAREHEIEKVTVYGTNNKLDFALRKYVEERFVEIVGSKRNLAPGFSIQKVRTVARMEHGGNDDLSEAMKQDCLRRSRGSVRFVIAMSLDEVVFPASDDTMATALQQLMSRDIDVYKIDTTEYMLVRDSPSKHVMKADLRTYELKNGSSMSSLNVPHIYDLNHGGNRTVSAPADKIRAMRLRGGKGFEKLKRIVYPVRLYPRSDDNVRKRFFTIIESLMEQDAKIRLAKKQMAQKAAEKFKNKISKGRPKM